MRAAFVGAGEDADVFVDADVFREVGFCTSGVRVLEGE